MPDGNSGRVKLGNLGSRLHDVKLVVLHVLARAGGHELTREHILERGWPDLFPHRDTYGLLLHDRFDYAAKMAERQHWMRIERDAGVALRDLRRKGLAKSHRRDGWAALHWLVTEDGRRWLEDEAPAFREAVLADLARLPTTAADEFRSSP